MKFVCIVILSILYQSNYSRLFKFEKNDQDSVKFMDYLTKNPFPQLQLVDIKKVYQRKLSQLDQRFLEQNEGTKSQNNLDQGRNKPQKEKSDEDFEEKEKMTKQTEGNVKDKKTPEQQRKEDQIFREERKKQYHKIDGIDVSKSIQYFNIQTTSHCDPYLRKHFIGEQYDIYRGFLPQETIPQQIQEKCYTMKSNCCSSDEMDYLDKRSYALVKVLLEQRSFLKKILIKIRSLSHNSLNEEFKTRKNQFKACMKGDPYQFDLSLKDLFNYLYQYEDEYEKYIDFITHRIYDYTCSFCSAEDTDFFLYSHQRNMYVNTAKAPEAVLAFYNMYNKVQQFYKLYGLANFLYCFKKEKYFQDYNRRHLDYQNRQDIEQFQKIDKNQLLKEEELMQYFKENYFPGVVYIPNFTEILKVLKLAIDDEQENHDLDPNEMTEHQIATYDFLNINYVLEVQTQQEDFVLSSKRQIILLNVNDGFYERKLKYDPRKFPKHEEYIKIYMLSLLISLIFLF